MKFCTILCVLLFINLCVCFLILTDIYNILLEWVSVFIREISFLKKFFFSLLLHLEKDYLRYVHVQWHYNNFTFLADSSVLLFRVEFSLRMSTQSIFCWSLVLSFSDFARSVDYLAYFLWLPPQRAEIINMYNDHTLDLQFSTLACKDI